MADQVTVQILVSAVQGDTTVVGSFPQTVMATAPAGIYANTEGVAPLSGAPATLTYGGLTTPNGVWSANALNTRSSVSSARRSVMSVAMPPMPRTAPSSSWRR